jgi:amidase
MARDGDDLVLMSATDQAALIRERRLSPVELVELYLARIERLNPTLNCFVLVTGDEALEQAEVAEETVTRGVELPPFHGVPISIKDILSTAGVRTTRGSRAFTQEVPNYDDNDVARLKAAGFIVIGKTNTPEFAIYPWTEPELFGATRNPWDTDLTPGGSTGGVARRWPPASVRHRRAPTGAVRSAAQHPATASSGSSLHAGGSPAPHASGS